MTRAGRGRVVVDAPRWRRSPHVASAGRSRPPPAPAITQDRRDASPHGRSRSSASPAFAAGPPSPPLPAAALPPPAVLLRPLPSASSLMVPTAVSDPGRPRASLPPARRPARRCSRRSASASRSSARRSSTPPSIAGGGRRPDDDPGARGQPADAGGQAPPAEAVVGDVVPVVAWSLPGGLAGVPRNPGDALHRAASPVPRHSAGTGPGPVSPWRGKGQPPCPPAETAFRLHRAPAARRVPGGLQGPPPCGPR